MAVKIALFNHKGGVGKTTLTVNLSYALVENDMRVMIVDADPQCNLSSYLIDEDLVNELLDSSDSAHGETIWSGLKPVVEGIGPLKPINPIEVFEGLFVIPGDIKLSTYERDLFEVWGGCFQRQPRALNVTTAMSNLVSNCAKAVDADVVFYDCGPNVGALNRIALLDCDFFVVPAALDQFSIRALTTLGSVLIEWIQDWDKILDLAPSGRYLFKGQPLCLGYIAQRFRLYRGKASADYSALIPELERRVISDLLAPLSTVGSKVDLKTSLRLGDIPDLGAIAQRAQRSGVPIVTLARLSRIKRDSYSNMFNALADGILSRIDS